MNRHVVVCEGARLVEGLRVISGLGPFSWTFLGTHIDFFYRIHAELCRHGRYVCSGQPVNEAARRARAEFLQLDDVFAFASDDLLWSCTNVAEKSPLTSALFYDVCATLAMPTVLNKASQNLLIITGTTVLAKWLGHLLQSRNDCSVTVCASTTPDGKGNMAGLRLHRNQQKVRRRLQADEFLHRVSLRKRLVRELRRVTCTSLDQLPRQLDTLCVVWASPDTFGNLALNEPEEYWGRLLFWLKAANSKVAYLVNPLDWIYPVERIYEAIARTRSPVLFIEDCLEGGTYEGLVKQHLKLAPRFSRRWRFDNIDFTPLLREAFHTDLSSGRSLFALQFYCVADFLKQHGFSVGNLLHLYENQPWEKALRLGFRRFLPETNQIGYQPNPYSEFWLSAFPSNKDLRAGNIPDLLACQGEHWKKQFARHGFPDEKLSVWPAFRFGYLHEAERSIDRRERNRERLNVLLALVIDPAQSLEMLIRTIEAVSQSPEIILEIRFHPRMGVADELLGRAVSLAKLSSLPGNATVKSRPIATALAENHAFIGNGSSVEFEAAKAGLRTICLRSELSVDQNVMPTAEYDFTVRTSEELTGILRRIFTAEALQRVAPWPSTKVQTYFQPENEQTKARVMRELSVGPDQAGESTVQATRSHPKVSIVIPCFNYANYLPEAVSSVIHQTFQDFEIIVVNDGSTDNSLQVATALMSKFKSHRIRLFDQPNSGQPAISRNTGIGHARGEYILPLDADDTIAPNFLEECVRLLDAHPKIAIAYTDSVYVTPKRSWIQPALEYDLSRLIHGNILCYCSMYRRAAWLAVGGYKENVKGYEDWDFWIACGERGFHGKRIPQPLFFYRAKEDGLFHDALKRDRQLRAQIVLNHPALYAPEIRAWAKDTVEAVASPSKQSTSAQDVLSRLNQRLHKDRTSKEPDCVGQSPANQSPSNVKDLGENSPVRLKPQHSNSNSHAPRQVTCPDSRCIRIVVATAYWFAAGGTELLASSLAMEFLKDGFDTKLLLISVNKPNLGQPPADLPRELQTELVSAFDDDSIFLALQKLRPNVVLLLADGHTRLLDVIASWPGHCSKIVYININNEILSYFEKERAFAEDRARMLRSYDVVAVMGASTCAARFLSEYQVPFRVVHTGVPSCPPAVGTFRDRFALPKDIPLLVYPALVKPSKNQVSLVRAAARIKHRVQLCFIGTHWPGQYFERFSRAVASSSNCRYIGLLTRDEVASALQESTLCLFPSLNEGAPLTLLEAMRHSVPWLTTPEVEFAKELEGGIIASVDDFPEIIDDLISNAERRRQLGSKGKRQFEETFKMERVVKRFGAIIQEVVTPSQLDSLNG